MDLARFFSDKVKYYAVETPISGLIRVSKTHLARPNYLHIIA